MARDGYLFDECDGKNQKYATSYELVWDFELIEDQTIDIDSIKEVNYYFVISAVEGKTEENIDEQLATHTLTINQIIQAVKHLNKEIQSIKERK